LTHRGAINAEPDNVIPEGPKKLHRIEAVSREMHMKTTVIRAAAVMNL